MMSKDKEQEVEAQEAQTEESNVEESEVTQEEASTEEQSTKDNKKKSRSEKKDEKKSAKLEAELAEFKDKYIRLHAEFENFRKRTSKEKLDLIETASKDLILQLLPVVDDFERAQKSYSDATDINAITEGVELIITKLVNTLTNKGLKPIEAVGQPFDTELHEAITQIPAPSDDMKGKVVDEIEKGYYLGEKVIRYSKVVIGN